MPELPLDYHTFAIVMTCRFIRYDKVENTSCFEESCIGSAVMKKPGWFDNTPSNWLLGAEVGSSS